MAFIEIKNLDKTFFPNTNREQHALKDVNLKINDGDFITILGGNGAGKSTFLNAIAGSFSLDSGEILIDDVNIGNIVEHKRAEFISRVFQNPLDGTAPRMTVAQNMSLALRRGKHRGLKKGTTKEDRKYFKELLKTLDLGLEDRLDSEMGLLSGGQRQAIALLMATINTPKLLLLDEHTAALDPKTQKKIMELTRGKIEEKKLTTLMITHNIQDAVKYGNRIIILHRGELVRDISRVEKEKLNAKQLYEILYSLEESE
ncbi:ABC transporter ATP-binding protein [Gemella cuniculi]|uniref:ABC transporter ATP-binding protein n=1 Tax=Gemella cuniculi TaxID=150240 RepID=UPI0004129781|nr:ATP-binding cassette domain-containing protein [Gemella cuniculi]